MQEEAKEGSHPQRPYAEFRKLTSSLRDIVKKRQDLVKAGATQEELLSNREETLYLQVRIRESFRELHQVIMSDQKTEAKSNKTAKEKSRLETISNYYEGLLYQKNNIEREILNCRNVALPDLEKLEEMKDMIEMLGKRVNPTEIEELDKVFILNQKISDNLAFELQKRKSMKKELQTLSSTANEKAALLYQRKENMHELPKVIKDMETNIRKAYSLFFNEKIMSKQELMTIACAPQRLNLAIQRFHNATKSKIADNPIKNVSIDQLEEDYTPRQLGLLHSHTFTVTFDLAKRFGASIERSYSLVENAALKQIPLVFDMTVKFAH